MLKLETPVLRPSHAKSWLIRKDFDAGRDWGQEEKGTTEDEKAGWHHWLDGHESEWTPGVGDGQRGLACCDSWGRKESDTTEQLNWTELTDGEDCLSSSEASFLCIFDSWDTTSPSHLPVPRHLMTFPSYWWLPSQSHFCEIFSTSVLFLESRFHNCSDFHLMNLMKCSKKKKSLLPGEIRCEEYIFSFKLLKIHVMF